MLLRCVRLAEWAIIGTTAYAALFVCAGGGGRGYRFRPVVVEIVDREGEPEIVEVGTSLMRDATVWFQDSRRYGPPTVPFEVVESRRLVVEVDPDATLHPDKLTVAYLRPLLASHFRAEGNEAAAAAVLLPDRYSRRFCWWGIAAHLLLLSLLTLFIRYAVYSMRESVRIIRYEAAVRSHRCPTCRYSTRYLTSGRCPECGTSLPSKSA